ncbi:hypothetical protein AYI70_g4779, partial [Smittium culicis]
MTERRIRRVKLRPKETITAAKVELKTDINKLLYKYPPAIQADIKKIVDSKIKKVSLVACIKISDRANPISIRVKMANNLDKLADKQAKPIQNLQDKISPKQLGYIKKALDNIKNIVVNRNLANPNKLKVLPSELNRKINESLHNIKNIAPEIPKKVVKKLINNKAKLDRLKKLVEKLKNADPKAIIDKINNKLNKARNNQRNALD